jgi:hypothetical protein
MFLLVEVGSRRFIPMSTTGTLQTNGGGTLLRQDAEAGYLGKKTDVMWRIAWGLMQATKAIGATRFLRPREHRQKAGDGHGAKNTYEFPTPHTHPQGSVSDQISVLKTKSGSIRGPMSALSQKQTYAAHNPMSAKCQ